MRHSKTLALASVAVAASIGLVSPANAQIAVEVNLEVARATTVIAASSDGTMENEWHVYAATMLLEESLLCDVRLLGRPFTGPWAPTRDSGCDRDPVPQAALLR